MSSSTAMARLGVAQISCNSLIPMNWFQTRLRQQTWHKASSAVSRGMMILITRREYTEAQVLKVDGHLSAEDTDVLVHAREAETGSLVLDLTGLRFADRRGVDTLRELRARGITLTGLSPYLSLVLASSDLPDQA